jgi:hypothetical protein
MFQKLLVLAAVIAIAWYGFKLVGRINDERKRKVNQDKDSARDRIANTVKCPVCDAYIAEGASGACDKPGCPN